MGRNRTIFPIALVCSLCVHAIGMDLYVHYGSFLIQPIGRSAEKRSRELVVKVDPDMLDFGEADGKAIGSNRSPGDEPMQAREADEDQALLSREPVGSGKQANAASGASGPTGGGMPTALSAPTAPAVPLDKTRPPTAVPAPPASVLKQVAEAEPKPQVQVSEKELDTKPEVIETPPASADTKPQPQRVQVAVAMPAPGQEARPGVPSSAGLPLPPSDSDSDPFARISGTVVFRNGRLDAQRGRKVKTVRPQIGIAGEMDAMGMANAVYHWTFEPTRDKAGNPIRDVVYFAIEYR